MVDDIRTLPLAVSVGEGARLLGLGRTRVYELIGAGQIDALKSGSRTLLTTVSIMTYLQSLPRATIRMKTI